MPKEWHKTSTQVKSNFMGNGSPHLPLGGDPNRCRLAVLAAGAHRPQHGGFRQLPHIPKSIRPIAVLVAKSRENRRALGILRQVQELVRIRLSVV